MLLKLWELGMGLPQSTLVLFSHLNRLDGEFHGLRAACVALVCAGILRVYWTFYVSFCCLKHPSSTNQSLVLASLPLGALSVGTPPLRSSTL
jgi:hypothetical protein